MFFTPFLARILRLENLRAIAALVLVASLFPQTQPLAQAVSTSTSGSVITNTYTDKTTIETWTVPSNVTSITVTLLGGQGSRGGNDSAGRPPTGGYQGKLTGTISVTPGQILRFGVGGGAAEPQATGGSAGTSNWPTSPFVGYGLLDSRIAVPGTNPLTGYSGGYGGSPGPNGSSGYGGAGGAASVIQIGTAANPTSTAILIAGGSGGAGGSGQFAPTVGQISLATHSARTDATTTVGQDGWYVSYRCVVDPQTSGWCDGGGGAGGGGGAQGGSQGDVPFGSGTSTEYFGKGGAPGQNSDGGLSGLTGSYSVYSGNNASGSIVVSYSNGVASAPTGINGTITDAGINLYWQAPSSIGNSAISNYLVEYAPGAGFSSFTTAAMCTGTSLSCAVTGLINGTNYKFRVSAINSAGTSAASALSQTLTPSGPPAAPTLTGVTASDGALAIAFTAGSSGVAITSYQYSIDSATSWISVSGTTSPITISGLTNGTSYGINLRAVSSAGNGAPSNRLNGTPSGLPGAPTITSITAGSDGTTLILAFISGYAGGSTIDYYEYATSVGENTTNWVPWVSTASTTSPYTITGLANGTTYSVRLRAHNASGSGAESVYQVGQTLAPPNTPTGFAVTTGDSQVLISYTAYNNTTNGGSAISLVEYSLNGGTNWISAGTLANPFTVSSLTNGTSYSIRIRATNPIGTSSASGLITATPVGLPGIPTAVQAASAPASTQVSWVAPLNTGGATIESYTAAAFTGSTGGSAVQSCTSATLTCAITGLTNATTYYIQVYATNRVGNSPASSPRVAVTPAALPGAPSILSISASNTFLSVAFSAGTSDINAPITGYQASTDGGSTWQSVSGTTSPLIISSLTNGITYSVRIRATSAVGNSAQSGATSGMPFTSPDATVNATTSYTAANGSVTVQWQTPNLNGSVLASYRVTLFDALNGGSAVSICTLNSPFSSPLSCTFNSLNNGTTYYVSTESIPTVGATSPRSSPRIAVVPGQTPNLTLAVSSATANYGDTITETATVGAGVTGFIQFRQAGNTISGCSSVAIVSTVAVCTTTTLPGGTYALQASFAGNATYSSALTTGTNITINPVSQTLTFADLTNKVFGDGSFTVSGSSTSSLALTFSTNTSSYCSVVGTTVTILNAGTCNVIASQAGTSSYTVATPITRAFTISPKLVTISGTSIAAKVYNASFTAGAITVGTISGLVGSDSINASAGAGPMTSANVGTNSAVVTYTLTNGSSGLAANYRVDTATVSAGVTRSTQSIISTLDTAVIRLNDSPVTVTGFLTASSGLTLDVVSSTPSTCTVTGLLITPVALGLCSLTATQVGDGNYFAAADVSDSFTVLAAIVVPPAASTTPAASAPASVQPIQSVQGLASTVPAGGTSANIAWTPLAGPAQLKIVASDGSIRTLDVDPGTGKLSVNDLEPGFAYSITVTPLGTINSTSAQTLTFTLPPSQPSNVKADFAGGSLKVTWTGARGSANYTVAILNPDKTVSTYVVTDTTFSIPVTPGADYEVYVRAEGAAQLQSPISAPAITSIPPAPVLGPVLLATPVKLGAVLAQDGDQLVEITVGPTSQSTTSANPPIIEGGITITAPTWALGIAATSTTGQPAPLTDEGALVLNTGLATQVNGTGFAKNTTANVYIFSKPQIIGTVPIDENGNFSGKFIIPAGLELGGHTFQIVGVTPDLGVRTASIGVLVKKGVKVLPTKIVIPFIFTRFGLTPELKKQIAAIKAPTGSKVIITGFTSKSSIWGDRWLANQRAKSIEKYFLQTHRGTSVKVIGKSSTTEAACKTAKNRCAVITVS